MPRVGFEPRTPVLERTKTVHTLDHATTVVGLLESSRISDDVSDQLEQAIHELPPYWSPLHFIIPLFSASENTEVHFR
jgi:hypothetical protein